MRETAVFRRELPMTLRDIVFYLIGLSDYAERNASSLIDVNLLQSFRVIHPIKRLSGVMQHYR